MTVGTEMTADLPVLRKVEPFAWQDLARLLDGLGVLLLGVTSDGRINYFNQAVKSLTGYSSEELASLPVRHVLTATADSRTLPPEVRGLRQASGPVRFECSLQTRTGGCRVVRFSGTVRREPGGHKHLMLVGTDTTPRLETLGPPGRPGATGQPEPAPFGRAPADPQRHRVARGTKIDRRRVTRHHYPYEQEVAPIEDDRLPSREAFRLVSCRDISPKGFSFLTREPPCYDKLVAAFGSPQAPIYVVARVIHISMTGIDGKPRYLVGCQYIGRASYALPADGSDDSDGDEAKL